MKPTPIIALALLLTAGCNPRKMEAPPMDPEQIAPGGELEKTSIADEAPAPAPPAATSVGRAAICTTPECEEACENAGELKTACADAFAQGCMSDVKPDPSEFDCEWQKKGVKAKRGFAAPNELKEEEPSDEEGAAKEPKGDGLEAAMEDEMD